MPHLAHILVAAAPWTGLSLLALIFMANALGVLDQSVAVRELAGAGVPGAAARVMARLGRLVQLVATPCLFFAAARPYAAVVLAGFLVVATLTAHAFWKTPRDIPGERDRQLANFLKNSAIVGGLLLAAGWSA
jgi:uncharacterized membrane protein YphA (DoxX/SURF4 family)